MAISEDAQKYLVAVEKKRKMMEARGGSQSANAYIEEQKKIGRSLDTKSGDKPTSNAGSKPKADVKTTPVGDDSNLRANARSVLEKKNGVKMNVSAQAKDGTSRSRIAEAVRPKPVGKVNPGAFGPAKVKMNATGKIDMKKRH